MLRAPVTSQSSRSRWAPAPWSVRVSSASQPRSSGFPGSSATHGVARPGRRKGGLGAPSASHSRQPACFFTSSESSEATNGAIHTPLWNPPRASSRQTGAMPSGKPSLGASQSPSWLW
jgi:hypothetical protein